jgi:P4 family phage/plasmid primase-like protien
MSLAPADALAKGAAVDFSSAASPKILTPDTSPNIPVSPVHVLSADTPHGREDGTPITAQLNIPDTNPFVRTARLLRQRGFAIVWLDPGEKKPTQVGWTRQSMEPEDYTPDANLGQLCGRVSGDTVTIDLDADDALALADDYLPPTGMVEGRPGKPRSHRAYRVTDIPERLRSKTAGGGIGGPRIRRLKRPGATPGVYDNVLEFIGTGGQVAVPPSIHPKTGERRVWYDADGNPTDQPGEPATLPMEVLWEAFCRLGQACGCRLKAGDLQDDPPSVQPRKSKWTGKPVAEPSAGAYPWEEVPVAERVVRCRTYLEHVPPAVSGHGGHDATYRVARIILNDFAIPAPEAQQILDEFNANCEPPWEPEEIDHKIADALKAPEDPARPKGCKLFTGTTGTEEVERHEALDDPDRLARRFLGDNIWRWWRSEFCEFDGTRYLPLADGEAVARVHRAVKDEFNAYFPAVLWAAQQEFQADVAVAKAGNKPAPTFDAPVVPKVTVTGVNNVVAALKAQCLLPGTREPFTWLDGRPSSDSLTLHNGILDLDSLQLQPHSPDWFSPVCLPYAFDPAADCPRWKKALALSLEGDADRIALLQEWSGYLLVRSTGAQKFLMLTGEGGNGKSVVCAAAEAMLGPDNVSHVPLEKFGAEFHLTSTLGKLANVHGEIGEIDRSAEGLLKAFTSGDPMNFNRKGKSMISAVPTARLMFATNNPPRFSDKSSGIWRRLLLVPFRVEIPVQERVVGMTDVGWWLESGELPGILNWALEGLRRLRGNGWRFAESGVCQAALEEHRTESNPMRAFLLEHYEAGGVREFVPGPEAYKQYCTWCAENGHLAAANVTFGREVRRAFPSAQHGKGRVGLGRPAVNGYFGLRPLGGHGACPGLGAASTPSAPTSQG